jgi:hypothetical protein
VNNDLNSKGFRFQEALIFIEYPVISADKSAE